MMDYLGSLVKRVLHSDSSNADIFPFSNGSSSTNFGDATDAIRGRVRTFGFFKPTPEELVTAEVQVTLQGSFSDPVRSADAPIIKSLAVLDSGCSIPLVMNTRMAKALGVTIRPPDINNPRRQPIRARVANGKKSSYSGSAYVTIVLVIAMVGAFQLTTQAHFFDDLVDTILIGNPVLNYLGISPSSIALRDHGVSSVIRNQDDDDPDPFGDDELMADRNYYTMPEFHNRTDPANAKFMRRWDHWVSTKYAKVFSPIDGHENPTVTPFHLALKPDSDLKSVSYRRLSDAKKAVADEFIMDRISRGIWQPVRTNNRISHVQHTSPLNLVVKPGLDSKGNKKFRPTLDYVELNKHCLEVNHPIPRVDELLHKMSKCPYLSLIDLASGYDNCGITEEAKELLAISVGTQVFIPSRLTQGIKGAAAWFQKIMREEVLPEKDFPFAQVYIDDIIIHSNSLEEHATHLEKVLQRLDEVNFRVNPEKITILAKSLEYLGFLVSKDGITLSEGRRQGLRDIKIPTNKKELKSFLGKAGWNRDHIDRYAEIVGPLQSMTGKRKSFDMTPDAIARCVSLKKAIIKAPLLHFADPDKPLYVRSDASDYASAGFVFQLDENNREIPLGFWSAAFDDTQSRWHVSEKELYGLLMTIRKFETIIHNHRTIILQTDHANLRYIHKADQSPKVVRWRNALLDILPSYTIEHISGVENYVCDALSRLLQPHSTAESNASATPETVSPEHKIFAFFEDVDPMCRAVLRTAGIRGFPEDLIKESDIMALQTDQIAIIQQYHNGIDGHSGVDRIVASMQRDGHRWPRMRHDLQTYINRCAVCQKTRAPLGRNAAAVRHIVVERPFASFSFDALHIGKDSDDNGYEWLLVAIDEMSRFVEATPIRSQTSEEGFDFFVELMARYGHPTSRVRVDQHGEFLNNIMEQYCAFKGIELSTATPRHHRSNGKIERAHRDILERLRALTQDKPISSAWSRYVKMVVQSHNHAVCWSTGVSPVEIIYAGQVSPERFPAFAQPIAERSSRRKLTETYMEKLVANATRIQRASLKHEAEYFAKVVASDAEVLSETSFDEGDWVLYKRSPEVRAETKLMPPWIGPWLIKKKSHNRRYVIIDPNDVSKTREVFVDSLKLFLQPVDCSDDALPLLRQNLAAQDDRGFIIERIVSHSFNEKFRGVNRPIKEGYRFRVRWLGFPESEDDYLPFVELDKTEAMVKYLKDKAPLSTILRRRIEPNSAAQLAKDKTL